jgi:hypothetical protein
MAQAAAVPKFWRDGAARRWSKWPRRMLERWSGDHRYRAVYDGVAQAKVARRCAVGESSDV